MRHLPSGVCVVTFGQGDVAHGHDRDLGLIFVLEPPTMLVSVNRASSSYAALAGSRAFGVNVLASEHQDVANRFTGRGGEQGLERYAERRWFTLNSGVWLLSDAVAVFDCEIEEIIERHTHAIVIGRITGLVASGGPARWSTGEASTTNWAGRTKRFPARSA